MLHAILCPPFFLHNFSNARKKNCVRKFKKWNIREFISNFKTKLFSRLLFVVGGWWLVLTIICYFYIKKFCVDQNMNTYTLWQYYLHYMFYLFIVIKSFFSWKWNGGNLINNRKHNRHFIYNNQENFVELFIIWDLNCSLRCYITGSDYKRQYKTLCCCFYCFCLAHLLEIIIIFIIFLE